MREPSTISVCVCILVLQRFKNMMFLNRCGVENKPYKWGSFYLREIKQNEWNGTREIVEYSFIYIEVINIIRINFNRWNEGISPKYENH